MSNKPNYTITYQEYLDKVMDYLDYMNYPEYVYEFEPANVAQSIFRSCQMFYITGQSPRMAAIVVFSLTLNFQIMSRKVTVN